MSQGIKNSLIGTKINMLTIIDRERRNKKTYYLCRCDCGNQKWIRADSIASEVQKSCGCLKKETQFKHKDLTGVKFGRLTVLEDLGKIDNQYFCKCKCECGSIKIIKSKLLISKHTKSCGCLSSESVIKNQKLAFEKFKDKYLVEGTSLSMIKKENPIKTNTSGVTGVTWDKRREKWMAQIIFKGKHYYLGRYDNKEDAVKARKEAEEKLHKEFLRNLEKEN